MQKGNSDRRCKIENGVKQVSPTHKCRAGETVLAIDDRLAKALSAITEKERNIILMYWFLDMADRDIADHMGIARRTVNTHRQRAYRLLKKLMGGEADE